MRNPLFYGTVLAALAAGCGPAESSSSSATTTAGAAGASGASPTGGSAGAGGTGGAAGATSAGGSGGGADPRFDALIAVIEQERKDLGVPGVAVAVIEDGKVTFARGFGSKDPSADVPVLPTTLFRIGSVNKMLTTTALLEQVNSGKVDLTAPVTTYVPGLHFTLDATWASTIHVEHLLTHSSAMSDYLQIDVPAAQKTDAALGQFLTGDTASDLSHLDYLMAPAGAFWNYSNPNFYLAGYIAEVEAGKPYRQVMKEGVFTPLGMDRTYFLGSEVLADGDYAIGKTGTPGVPASVKPDTYDNPWARPAGYASSSVLDLAKFVGFLMDGNEAVLPKALVDEMQSPHIPMQTFLDLDHYGYGLEIFNGFFLGAKDKFVKMKLVEHDGDIPGFAASVTFVPEKRFGFITLASTDNAHFRKGLLTALITLAGIEPNAPAPDITVDPSTFPQLEGVYQDDYNAGPINVTNDMGTLKVSIPAADMANIPYDPVLQPVVPNNFILTIQGYPLPVTFLPDASGTMRYFRTRAFVGTRPMAPPPPPPVIEGARRDRFLSAIRAAARPTAADFLLHP